MSRRLAGVAALLAALCLALLSGCATPSQGSVVLLPNPANELTAVTVTQGDKALLLAQPFAAAQLTREGPKSFPSSAQQVQAQFAAALAAQPLPPAQFTLYFVEGKDELTPESLQVVDHVFSEIAKRPVPDVMVIGHTDTVGSDAANDALSHQRAEFVRRAMLARGIKPEQLVLVGRGKRELLVPTADGVAEPRNRRVQILVR
jgi:outer membrane protein OmpA-like peptidoglycan-associated protein